MTTIADVAKRAGVSKMTVSRVINNSGYISPETRERVDQALADLRYIPNVLARSLRFKKTRTIGLIVSDITNPFFTTLARGVEDAASEQGFSVIFCNTDESIEDEHEYLNVLVQKQIDGLLLVPASSSPDSIMFLQERGTPFVLLDRYTPDVPVDIVCSDSEQGAYEMMQHLLQLGHRRIVALSSTNQITTSVERLTGYRRALTEAGVQVNGNLIFPGAFTVESGYQRTKHILTTNLRPTAIFGFNNFVVIGALRALREAGMRTPNDVSVVSFDDMPGTCAIDPFLTVVVQSPYQMGQTATTLLLNRLTTENADDSPYIVDDPQHIVLPTELIVRQSSGPPPTGNSIL